MCVVVLFIIFHSGLGCRMYCSWYRSGSNGKSNQASVAVAVTVASSIWVLAPPPPPAIRLIFVLTRRICKHPLFSTWNTYISFRYGLRQSLKPFAYLYSIHLTKLAQLRWFGYIVRMGRESYPKMAQQVRTQFKRPQGRLQQTWDEGIQKILNDGGIECNRIRAIARILSNPLRLLVKGAWLSTVKWTETWGSVLSVT
jgi:hypothetical protein